MAEGNGEMPLSGDPRVDAALKRIRGKFQDLEDAMIVQSHLEKRQSEQNKAHAQWLEQHDEAKRQHDEWMLHFQAKLDALTDIVMKREAARKRAAFRIADSRFNALGDHRMRQSACVNRAPGFVPVCCRS